ncbi:hypothetical protein TNCV_4383661 [Trichonephila clavipes]|nr:hypothetical protein TNCV_4383661 [Trichonephila clavipes]
MLKHLRFDIFELQEAKLLVRLINTTNERRLVQGHGGDQPSGHGHGFVAGVSRVRVLSDTEDPPCKGADACKIYRGSKFSHWRGVEL